MKFLIVIPLFFTIILACTEKKNDEMNITDSRRCANCGMLTGKYPSWEQQVIFSEGDTLWFDGARCMFKVLLDSAQKNINPQKILVKDYYNQEYVDGKSAFYVIGSDVLGPMGHELIPFKSAKAAKEFMSDHKGKTIFFFDEVDKALVKALAGKMKM